jgi:hypothetical protein
MAFRRIRVPGEDKVDVDRVLAAGETDWRAALKA